MIRVSGSDAFAVVGRVAKPWPLPARQARLCEIGDPETGEALDRGIVACFPAPRSYTGEDVVELTVHGGTAVSTAVLAALVSSGAREAEPGEFTRRAVLNGKMDLVQAEAVGDLIDARTGAARQAALAQVDGGLSRRIASLRDDLIQLEALIAYDVDFPEEDDGPVSRDRVVRAARRVLEGLDTLLATSRTGDLVRDGAVTVIAGAPNAGKSSLFNALLGEERAIVTDIAGTTRDAVDVLLDSRPLPLRLVDTAGIREAPELVERLGIEVSQRWLSAADVVLACGDSDADARNTAAKISGMTSAPVITVRTKADAGEAELAAASAGSGTARLTSNGTGHATARLTSGDAGDANAPDTNDGATSITADREAPALPVSAHTGHGLRELVATIQQVLAEGHSIPAPNAPIVTRARQRRAIDEARTELQLFIDAWIEDVLPAPVAAVHTRAAITALETLIGGVDVEEVLGRVFGEFCVGK